MWWYFWDAWTACKLGVGRIDPNVDSIDTNTGIGIRSISSQHDRCFSLFVSSNFRRRHVCANTTPLLLAHFALPSPPCSAFFSCGAVTWLGSTEQQHVGSEFAHLSFVLKNKPHLINHGALLSLWVKIIGNGIGNTGAIYLLSDQYQNLQYSTPLLPALSSHPGKQLALRDTPFIFP